jgi:glycosyltransferase involved in cell wall biosynthesis
MRIAMALYADVSHDSRVLREATTLADAGHDVTIVCIAGAAPEGAPFRVIAGHPARGGVLPDGSSPFLRDDGASKVKRVARRVGWLKGYVSSIRAWGRWAVASAGPVDAWHAHDLTGLAAVAPLVKRPTLLVYDSHEIFLETGTAARLPGFGRRLLQRLERRWVSLAAALVTVNEAYAEVLERRTRPRRIVIVRNCPPRREIAEGSAAAPNDRIRDVVGIPADAPVALYHGAFARHRGIEPAALAMLEPGMERHHLAILGFGSIRDELEAMAAEPRFGGRVHVLPAVPPDDVVDWVGSADVDVIALERSTLNHWLCTPNKLWESLTAGTPVVVSDFPVMRQIVIDDPAGALGTVCDPVDPASIAAAIRAITEASPEARAGWRARCREAAADRWNWETESARLVELYASLGAADRGAAGS